MGKTAECGAPRPTIGDDETRAAKTPAQQRLFRFKLFLLAAIVIIMVLAMLRGCYSPTEEPPAGPPPVSDQAKRAGGFWNEELTGP